MNKLIICAALLVLTSCTHHLERGTVLMKHYEPTHSYTTIIPIPLRVGKVTTFMMIPHRITDYEDYVLTIEGTNADGEVIHEEVYVDEACYKSHVAGDTWSKTETCSFSDPNNIKVRE